MIQLFAAQGYMSA